MPTLRRLVVLVIALAIALPAGAWAQTTTIPPNGGDLSDEPPVDLGDDDAGGENGGSPGGGSRGGPSDGADRGSGAGASDGRPGAAELPDTGSDPRLLFLAGLALVLIGLGLRLRSADADLY